MKTVIECHACSGWGTSCGICDEPEHRCDDCGGSGEVEMVDPEEAVRKPCLHGTVFPNVCDACILTAARQQ